MNECGNGNLRIADSENLFSEHQSIANISTYPNPFQDQTTIEFVLPYDSKTTVDIFTVNGIRIKTLFSEEALANQTYRVVFDRDQLPGNMFIYKINTEIESRYGKLITK